MLKRLLLSVPFLFIFLASEGFPSVLLDRVVAVVNDEAITWTELYRAMEFEMSKRMREISDEEKRRIFDENETEFLESMIEVKLQMQEAKRLGIEVGPEEVDRAIENIREKYAMDEETFLRGMREEGFTLEKYRELIHDQIVIGRLVEREVRAKMTGSGEGSGEGPDAEALNDGVLYGLSQIFFRLEEDEEMDAVSGKLTAVMEALSNGEDFGDLAARYSEGPAAERGGELGSIPKSQLAREFVAAVEDLRPGEVSRPFRTRQGVHIVMLTSRTGREEITREELFRKEYESWLRSLREKAFIEIRLD